ncbi:MAG: ATP synthase subunit F [Provencibacterium sp.]|jgi:V/A-type H+-transporting ATPase subunit F|nr:ATP synthase subunit F [Provencibacterium sp.]
MKFYVISDNIDTCMGMRLSGMPGTVVHEREEVLRALGQAMDDPEIGIILMTTKTLSLCRETVYQYKLERKSPLIVEIPDRHGSGNIGESIGQYVKQAIGVTI